MNETIAYLKSRAFDVVGVKSKEDIQLGFVNKNNLEGKSGKIAEHISKFEHHFLITEETSLLDSVDLIRKHNHLFLLKKNQISGIVTRADLQKMPVRLLCFSMMSYLEMIFSEIIRTYIDDNSLKTSLNSGRYNAANEIFEAKIKKDEAIDLISCIQLCDQRDILSKNPIFLNKLKLSKNKFKDEMDKMISIRNGIAHSQRIETVANDNLLDALTFVENILPHSVEFLRQAQLSSKAI